jgi:medium-chain acyl-[acyl-carrier-protein] hydrolase
MDFHHLMVRPNKMVTSTRTENWIVRSTPVLKPSLRLFCFPCAGAGASSFNAWPSQLQPDVDICAVQLPGRETRYTEDSFEELSPIIDGLIEAIKPWCDLPIAFFGHCLGALIAFELARQLSAPGRQGLLQLFVAGCRAPQCPPLEAPIHGLPDHHFLARLRELNQMPEAILQDPELLNLFMPVLRADFSVWESYVYAAAEPLDCSISAFGGADEKKLTQEALQQWSVQTRGPFVARRLPGDHFFIHSSRTLLLRFIGEDLRRALRRRSASPQSLVL